MAPSKSLAASGAASSQRTAIVQKEDAVKKPLSEPLEMRPFSPENMTNNAKVVYYCKTFLSIIAGVVAGILGLTGIPGFLLYLALMLLGGVGIWLKVGGEIRTYFDSWQKVFLDGISQGALSFVLFWTLAYDIVHIF